MVAVGLVCRSGFALAAAPATQPTAPGNADLQSQVNELRAELAAVKAQQAASTTRPSDQPSAAEMTQAMHEVISDADRESQLLDRGSDFTAGYADRRFFIASEDGNFTFKPWIHLQIRDSTNFRHDPGTTGDDIENGFELRRARLGFDGNFFTKDLTYFINWATNRQNGTLTVTGGAGGTVTSPVGGLPVLEEAWMKYRLHDTPWFIHVGQMHDPLDHENIIGSKYRAPEASLQGDIFGNTDTFTQAATFGYYDASLPVRFEAGVTDGIRAANTGFVDYPLGGVAYDGGVAGRIEYKITGNWKDYDQLTAYNDKTDLLVVGSGYDYSYGGAYYTLSHTVDLQYGSPNGLFAYLCYFGRYTNHQRGIPLTSTVSASFNGGASDTGADTYEPSALAEIGYMVTPKLEPFARYEYMYLQGTPAGSQNNVQEISIGANYYIYGHNVKLTGQAMYLPHGIPIGDDGSDVEASNGKAELVFISQLQFLL